MKTQIEILKEITKDYYKNFDNLDVEYIVKAMDEYRAQGRNYTEDEIRRIQEQHYEAGYQAGQTDNVITQ